MNENKMTTNEQKLQNIFKGLMLNTSMSRANMYSAILDPRRDLDSECGYPSQIAMEQYKKLYNREGLATRVVSLLPEESWADDPMISDQQDFHESQTEFENSWEQLVTRIPIFHYLLRADILSGIGSFGVLLMGIDDGLALSEQVDTATPRNLLYLRPFDEEQVTITLYETDMTNERYGLPVLYSIVFNKPTTVQQGTSQDTTTKTVHWSRIIHLADNRETSEVFGVPRMQPVYNRLYDLRKILGGSGEMFWKGAFPGYSFEMAPQLTSDWAGSVEIDTESIKAQFEKYSNGLQRYLALEGVTAKSLSPQVADPSRHVDTETKVIAMCLGVPYRIFIGSEEAKLASSEDTKRWNKRLNKRRAKYLNPLVLRPFIDRLIEYGILPKVPKYYIAWPDLNEETNKQKGDTFEVLSRGAVQLINAYNQGAPFSLQDLHMMLTKLGVSQTSFDVVKTEASERGELI